MLKHLSVFISLALASLYMLGLVSYQSFLRHLGIEETQFPLTLDRTFFQGFVLATDLGVRESIFLYMSSAVIVIVAEAAFLLSELLAKSDVLTKIRNHVRWFDKVYPVNSFSVLANKMFTYTSIVIIFLIVVLVAVIASDKTGYEFSKRFIENAKNGVLVKKSVTLKYNGEKIEGYSIVCNSTQCAYLVGRKTIVINNSDVYKIESLANVGTSHNNTP